MFSVVSLKKKKGKKKTKTKKHFSVVKFAMGYEKNMSFLVIPKSQKS